MPSVRGPRSASCSTPGPGVTAYLIFGCAYAFAAAVQPGPFLVYLVSQSLSAGWRRTLPAALAPLLSDGPVAVLVLFVLSRLSEGLSGVAAVRRRGVRPRPGGAGVENVASLRGRRGRDSRHGAAERSQRRRRQPPEPGSLSRMEPGAGPAAAQGVARVPRRRDRPCRGVLRDDERDSGGDHRAVRDGPTVRAEGGPDPRRARPPWRSRSSAATNCGRARRRSSVGDRRGSAEPAGR